MEDRKEEDNGKVSYDAQNKVLTLTSEKENGKIQQYQVKEDGSIAFLDEGKEITGELASYYILKKKQDNRAFCHKKSKEAVLVGQPLAMMQKTIIKVQERSLGHCSSRVLLGFQGLFSPLRGSLQTHVRR